MNYPSFAWSPCKKPNGFSLMEILVVLAITGLLIVLLFYNFRASGTGAVARHQITSVLVADIRRAQSMTASGTRYNDNVVCGYGVSYINPSSYMIYAWKPQTVCPRTDGNYVYRAGVDYIVETRTVTNANMIITGAAGPGFYDIFFEAPGPKTYINGIATLATVPLVSDIYIVNRGESCVPLANCTTVSVNKAGAINITN